MNEQQSPDPVSGSRSPDVLPNISTSSPPAAGSTSTHPSTQHDQRSNGSMAVSHPPHSLNPRSCVTCRRRKVKCDKKRPCSNCVRAGIDCIFPAPGRAPRKPRKPPDSELLARLRRLEGVVSSLGASVDENGNATMSDAPSGTDVGEDPNIHQLPKDHFKGPGKSSLDSSFGRLVIDEGRSRYVTRLFWANLSSEVEDLKSILNYSSDEEEPAIPTPTDSLPGNSPANNGFVFGFSSTAQDLSSFHPVHEHALKYWELYKEHCEPLVKIFHMPTMHEKITAAMYDPDHGGRSMEALLFSIYFAVATSISPEECVSLFGEQRVTLLKNYRFGIEQALAKANFLYSEELTTLQAFLIFLMCLRRHEDARVIWSLSALVVRIAMIMGLHRDGTNFGLSVFDTEMRRRTWWAVCILDIRTSEDHGCDPTIIEDTTDTKLPLNINDADISPSSTEAPPEREEITESTFCLIREEVAKVFRRLNTSRGHLVNGGGYTVNATLQDKERWIEDTHQRLEKKFLRYCDMNTPLHWVICTVARLMLAKMWLMIYHPYHRNGQALSQEIKDRLFITSIESIEYSLCMQTEVRTIKWGWLFKTYHQWHALAFILSELCHRTQGLLVARAWRAVEGSVASMADKVGDHGGKSNLWRPLGKLMAKARAAREKEVAGSQGYNFSIPPFTSGSDTTNNSAPPSRPMTDSPTNLNASQSAQSLTNLASASVTAAEVTRRQTFDGAQTDFRNPSSINTMPKAPTERSKPPGTLGPFMKSSMDWENINRSTPLRSPFFMNQPEIKASQASQWQGIGPLNNLFTQQWLLNQSQSNKGISNLQNNTNSQPGYFDQSTSVSPITGGPNGNLAGTRRPQQNGLVFDFSNVEQQQQQRQPTSQATHDPMVSGSEDTNMQWQDWDEMVREFELDGNANQWTRQGQPILGLGDSWL